MTTKLIVQNDTPTKIVFPDEVNNLEDMVKAIKAAQKSWKEQTGKKRNPETGCIAISEELRRKLNGTELSPGEVFLSKWRFYKRAKQDRPNNIIRRGDKLNINDTEFVVVVRSKLPKGVSFKVSLNNFKTEKQIGAKQYYAV